MHLDSKEKGPEGMYLLRHNSLFLSLSVKNLAAFPLEFCSLRRAGKWICSKSFSRYLLETQLGIFKAKIIELAHHLDLCRVQPDGFRFLLRHGGSVPLAESV